MAAKKTATKGTGVSSGILDTLGDFTSKENWDKFFALRGSGDSFEWYADWPELRPSLIPHLARPSSDELQVLVPGCGSSRLSEHLYDAGFRRITNIDFSKVVISDMLRRNIRSRPEMRWRVMDMTDLQFADEFFDVILDKGGLDALMEPEHGSELGTKYLKEVKRVLKSGGKYLCLTLAESHVLDLLFSELRFGWKTSIYAIPHKPGSRSVFQTFMVVGEKEKVGALKQIELLFDHSSVNCKGNQVQALFNAVEDENKRRGGYSVVDVIYSLKDLKLGVKGDLSELVSGRRCQFILGEQGKSLHTYKATLLDSQQSGSFSYLCGVFIVPKGRANEWLFTSEEGQWLIVESSKAARLIMVFLDSSHDHSNMDEIQKDLSPLVKHLAPGKAEDESPIPFMMANDGVKERNIIHEATSSLTGRIIIEDVMYEDADGESKPSEVGMFRRLTFGRSSGLVQSEALLLQESHGNHGAGDKTQNISTSKSRKKGQKRNDHRRLIDGSRSLRVDHASLASNYHSGIVSGFALILSYLESAVSTGSKIKTYIVGLGAGLLPMFLHGSFPFLEIEVVELDPVVLELAREYFRFIEDKRLKHEGPWGALSPIPENNAISVDEQVHICDGIRFIQDANMTRSANTINCEKDCSAPDETSDRTFGEALESGSSSRVIKVLIVDADSADLSSGLSCPPLDFVEESFLLSVRDFLSEGGLFVINLVSRSLAIRNKVISQLKAVFSNLFSLELEEDVNEILFAFPPKMHVDIDHLPEAIVRLRNLMKYPLPEGKIESCRFKCLK